MCSTQLYPPVRFGDQKLSPELASVATVEGMDGQPVGEMIAGLPEARQPGAWAALDRQRVDVLHRIMASEGPQGVADALAAIAASEGSEAADRLRTAWQDTSADWAARQDAASTPQARARYQDRVQLLAAEGQPWAVAQVASEGHRQAS
jgi:hypothetical protein